MMIYITTDTPKKENNQYKHEGKSCNNIITTNVCRHDDAESLYNIVGSTALLPRYCR